MARAISQNGAALVVGIVFTAMLTGMAVTLLYNSTMDQKIAAANSNRISSIDKALGGTAQILHLAVTKQENNTNFFTLELPRSEAVVSPSDPKLTYETTVVTRASTCSASKQASDVQSIDCIRQQITVNNVYGYNDAGKTSVVTAILQEVPNND